MWRLIRDPGAERVREGVPRPHHTDTEKQTGEQETQGKWETQGNKKGRYWSTAVCSYFDNPPIPFTSSDVLC